MKKTFYLIGFKFVDGGNSNVVPECGIWENEIDAQTECNERNTNEKLLAKQEIVFLKEGVWSVIETFLNERKVKKE